MKHGKSCAAVLGCVLLLGGCAAGGSADQTGATAVQPAAKAETAARTETVTTSEAVAKERLDAAARELVGRAQRTVVPSRAKPNMSVSGRNHIASYIVIDDASIFTSVRKGSTTTTPYTGIVEYTEDHMLCTGATRAKALADDADCKNVKSRRVKEFIRYDGRKWVY